MRVRRDTLVFRALVVLDEAVDACREAPLTPTLGLRLALMLLYALSDGERHAFDCFWRAIQERHAGAPSPSIARYLRSTTARTWMTAVARSAGVALDAECLCELRVARMSMDDRRAYREAEARLAEHRAKLRDDAARYAKAGGSGSA